jgi:hypothetical protein
LKFAASGLALVLFGISGTASAHPGHGGKWWYGNAHSPGTVETSDADCSGLTPTIYVDSGRIVGGPDDGRRYRGYIRGTNGDDIIFGTDYSERIYGRRGDDRICAFAGNDRIYGQRGEDTGYGGSGHDRLYGGKDNDVLIGGSGVDRLYGQWGDDNLDGGDHNDRLFGGRGNDALEGGPGYDKLYGGRDTDSCSGGEFERSCENEPTGVVVADVVSLNQADAESALAALGLSVNLTEAFDSNVAAGLVISQDPAAGAEVAPGSTVNLVVSIGPSSVIAGRVTDPAGNELQGIMVTATPADATPVTASVDTSDEGEFSLTLSSASAYTLKLTADDYADQVVVINSPPADGEVSLDITMIARGAPVTFNEDAGATVTGADGATVVVTADSFEEGASGTFEVMITPVDVGNASTLAAFPGNFNGTAEDGSSSPIVPLGTVEFEFTLDGQPINLRDGQTAQVQLPIYIDVYPNGDPVQVDDTIALWSLNEDTGEWEQEGYGTVVANAASPTGLALEATVSHFSWWNCDVSIDAGSATVIVAGAQGAGTALVNGNAPTLNNWRGTSVQSSPFRVPDPGQISGLSVPSGIEVCYSATINYDDGSTGVTPEVCGTAPANGSVTITLNAAGPGPLTSLITSPSPEADGSVIIDGFVNFPSDRVLFSPNTAEDSVSYSIISGSLPAGLSLEPIDDIRAEIVGIPEESGFFQVRVQGSAEGDDADIVVRYEISGGSPPPVLNQDNVFRQGNPDGSLFINLDSFIDIGSSGPIDNWSLTPVQAGLELLAPDPATGRDFWSIEVEPGTIPVVNPFFEEESEIWYLGTLTASGPGGADSLTLEIFEGFDFGDDGPQAF